MKSPDEIKKGLECCIASTCLTENGCPYRLSRHCGTGLKADALALIQQLEAQEPRWISVEDRLPDLIPCSAGTAYSAAVNILTSGRKVLTAVWDGKEFIADAEFWEAEGEEITHWTPVLLPLPDPPKEEAK